MNILRNMLIFLVIIVTSNILASASLLSSADLAAKILSRMDKATAPCENFWKFACGNAQNEDEDLDSQIVAVTNQELREIFADESPEGEPKPLTYVKNFFKACVSADPAKLKDRSRLKAVLDLLGGWPVLEGDSWSDKNRSWQDLQINLVASGFQGFFAVTPIENDYLVQKRSTVVDWTYQGDNELQADLYRERMVNLAVILGANRQKATAEIARALKFDKEIFFNTWPGYVRDNSSNIGKISALLGTNNTQILPIFGSHMREPRDRLLVSQGEMKNAASVLSAAPPRVIFNYALMRALDDVFSVSDNPQNRCIDFISARFPEAQEILYVRKYFNAEIKNDIYQLTKYLKDSLTEEYDKLRLELDPAEDHMIEIEIDDFVFNIGYPDEFFNDSMIEKFYQNFEFHGDDFLQGLINFMQYKINNSCIKESNLTAKIQEYVAPNVKIHHGDGFQQYLASNPTIDIPSGYLRIFSFEYLPMAVIHGQLFSKLSMIMSTYFSGSLDEASWVDEKERKHDSSNVEKNLNYAWATRGAYSTYKKWMDRDVEWINIPGLSFVNEQLFWIARAQLQCRAVDESLGQTRDLRDDFRCDV